MRQYVWTSVRPHVITFITKCTGNKWLDLKTLMLPHMHIEKASLLGNFHPIINILDLDFQGQRFKSRTLGSSCVTISHAFMDRANISIVNTGSRM